MKQQFYKRTFTIGADPEFVLYHLDKKCVGRAKDYKFFDKVRENAKIGRDGNAHPVEIRPSPTYINKLPAMIADIDNIMKRISVFCNANKLTILCGATTCGVSIGGHIHFGGADIRTFNVSERVYAQKSKKIKNFVNILDFYLIPIMNLFIPQKEIVKRINSSYGKIHSYRKQNWGIEYRTPYSFLASPAMTIGFYSLSCLLAHHYRQIKMTDSKRNLMSKYSDRLYKDSNTTKIFKEIYNITKPTILKMMSLYSPNPEYNPYILSIFNLIKQKKLFLSKDVLANYGYKPQEKKPTVCMYFFDNNLSKIVNLIYNTFKGLDVSIILDMKLSYGNTNLFCYYDHRYKEPKSLFNIQYVKRTSVDKLFDLCLCFSQSLIEKIINHKKYQNWLIKYIKKVLNICVE